MGNRLGFKSYLGGSSLFFGFALLMFCSLEGCYYDNAEDLYPMPIDTVDTTVTFKRDIKPFILNTCAFSPGCHGAGSNYPVFETHEQIVAKVDRIEARVLIEKTMPPSGQPRPTQEELDDLKQWIDEGAKNN